MAKPTGAKAGAKNLSKTIAIDIGSKNIKILRGTLNKTNGSVNITDVIIEPTPEGCVENGYIKSQTDLNLFLRAVIGKNNMSKCEANVVVRSSDIVAREISVPTVKGPKLKKLVENEIVTVFGNTADYYTDYVTNGTEVVDYKTFHKISAYAVPKELVTNYMDVINSSDIKPANFDVHRNVLSKLLSGNNVSINQEPIAGKVIVLADIGASYMDIDLIIDGVDVYKRSISIADDIKASEETTSTSNSLDDQIDAMYNGDGVYDGYEGYESYDGYEYGSDSNDDYMYGSSSRNKISPVLSRANEEIYKIMQFALAKYGNKPVTNIYLYGGNSRLAGLDQYLSTALEVTVDKVCSISNVEISSDVNLADVLIAAGSLIRK